MRISLFLKNVMCFLLGQPGLREERITGMKPSFTQDRTPGNATQHGQPYSLTKLPKPHIKGLFRKSILQKWQTSWKNGDTGRRIYNIMASVSLHPTKWIIEDAIFFSQHGPFPAYLKRFHLSDSDYCSCGRIGTALHYAMERIYTVSWHMRKPAPNFEQEWLKT
ncbi:hypothetical protein AVEN_23748-1 [Araneus ventricosus]|uniref:Uncharacterized protein n=1 Tax=Araneus ventricosus TaxID=182803 RepID=A0A4Y2RZ38_ARAVE|nr:hypothetical protein AVEN_23748-1 [Araneus ventricosus]